MDPMQQIWDKVATVAEGGEKLVVYQNDYDLVYLYANGFVDAEKFSLEAWLEAFASSKQKAGGYRVTHAQWMEKKKFRYAGFVDKPFDPSRLKDAEYSEAEFATLLADYLVPSTWLKTSSIPQVLKNYQSAGKFKNGKYIVDQAVKNDFAKMLQRFPSPLRVLQIDVHGMPKGMSQASGSTSHSSQFTQTVDAGEKAFKKLEALFQSPIKQKESAASNAATTTLKDLLKAKRRPPTGRV